MAISEQDPARSLAAAPPTGEAARKSRFSWRGFLVGVFVGLLLLLLWLGVTGLLAARDARALRASAADIEMAVRADDYSAAVGGIDRARGQVADLDRRLASLPWSWAQSLPGVGSTVAAAAAIVSATDEVLAASEGLEDGFAGAASGADLVGVALLLRQSAPDLQRLEQAAAAASSEVSAIDTSQVLEPVRGQFEAAQAQLLGALQPLVEAAPLFTVLPGMLGVGEPAEWLVVLSQPSEARGSGGGFYGAYLTMTVSDGRFAVRRAAANGPETAVRQDLSLLPAEYRRLWGSDAEYLWGFNLSRHYPYTASVIHRALDPSADYVVSLDPRSVAGLLAITGPITVDGRTLDADNAEQFFSRDIYVDYVNSSEKDQVTLQALQAVFAALGRAESLSPLQWWQALGPDVADGHVQVWSPDPAVEGILERSVLGGAVPALSAPWVTVAFNNSAGNKIDSFVKTSMTYTAEGSCQDGTALGSLVADLSIDPLPAGLPGYISGRNDEPTAPYGTTSMLVHLYGPSGAVGTGSVMVNGQPVSSMQGMERGHPVWGVKVQLAPDEPVEVRVDFEQPAFAGEPLVARAQPMVQDTEVVVVDRRSCS